jgi:hypothetical protein
MAYYKARGFLQRAGELRKSATIAAMTTGKANEANYSLRRCHRRNSVLVVEKR